jgi:hypothetical protein
MRQRRKKPARFEQQSRRRQKNAYIDAKNRIRRDAPILGGKFTTHDYRVESQHRAIADSGELQVFEEWTLYRDYSRGIGVHATLDVPFLTIDVVNEFIDRFLAQEADYRSAAYRTWKYDQVPHWGLESNAVIDPLDWPQEQRYTLVGSVLRYDSPTDPVWPDHED